MRYWDKYRKVIPDPESAPAPSQSAIFHPTRVGWQSMSFDFPWQYVGLGITDSRGLEYPGSPNVAVKRWQ